MSSVATFYNLKRQYTHQIIHHIYICIYAHKSSWNHYIKVNNTQYFPLPVWCPHVRHPYPVFKQHPSILCYSELAFLSLDLIQITTMLLSDVLSLTTIIMPLHTSAAPSFQLWTLYYPNIYNFLAYLSVGIHSSFAQGFLCENKPAVNIYVQLFLWACIYFVQINLILRNEMDKSKLWFDFCIFVPSFWLIFHIVLSYLNYHTL